MTASTAVKEGSQVRACFICMHLRCGRNPITSWALAGSVSVTAREDESKEAALERRLRESARVEERVIQIFNEKEFHQQLEEVSCNLYPGTALGITFTMFVAFALMLAGMEP